MMIKFSRILLSAALLAILLVSFRFVDKKENQNDTSFTTSISADATPAVLAHFLEADKMSPSQITFEKGTYHFYPDKGLEEYCYISNHCDVMVRTAFPLKGFKNLTIDGQGSTFIFHGVMIPFLVDKGENITIKNVSIDWQDPFHSEGTIVAHDEKNHTFDMSISKEYPYEIRDKQLFFIKEYYEHPIGQSICFDPKTKAIAFDTEAYTNLSTSKSNKVSRYLDQIDYKYTYDSRAPEFKKIGRESRLEVEEIKPGVVRIFNHGKKLPKIGWILTMKGEQGFNRVAPAFRITSTFGFTAENVTVHHAGGMGMIAENSGDLLLHHFKVTPSHGRMVSTTADATHFVGCRGKVELKDCVFSNQLDDASNIHGTYQIIEDVLDDHRLGVRMGHHQQQGFVVGKANDKIGLVRIKESFFPYLSDLTIKDIKYINSRYQIITFKERLPKTIQTGDFVENLTAYPEVLVQNCTITNNRARGLLLSTPKKTIIENNLFHTEMEGILIPVESGHWYESGNGAHITIRNNTFQDCQHSGFDRGVIRFATDDDNTNIAFRDIKITGNTFNQFDNLILQITNAEKVQFTGNTITNSGTFKPKYSSNPVVKVHASKDIEFSDNSYIGKARNLLESDAISEVTEFE